MKLLISPSKTMDTTKISPTNNTTSPHSLTISLLNTLISLDFDSLKMLYKSSDQVVDDTILLLRHPHYYKSIELFNGAVFKNINYTLASPIEQEYINNNLFIFSALYGIVSANDAIRPYRLDLNNSLKPHISGLTKLWQQYVTEYLNTIDDTIIIDLASSEYRKLINFKHLKKDYIKIEFKDLKNNQYKVLGTYAKMARGQFIQALAQKNITEIADLKTISVMNYQFNNDLSDKNNYIFTR